MQPYFTIGQFQVAAYYVLYSLGGLVGGWMCVVLARGRGYTRQRIARYLLLVVPTCILAGLVNGMLFNADLYRGLARGVLVLGGGIVSYGVIAAILVVTALTARHYATPVAVDLDLVARVLPVMLAIFRLGCLLNGCCYGRETDGWLGSYLPNVYGEWAWRYPTQGLMMAGNLAMAMGLWLWSRRRPEPGTLLAAFLLLFGLGRLLIDGLRERAPILGPFNIYMLADLIFLSTGLVLGVIVWRRRRRWEGQPEG